MAAANCAACSRFDLITTHESQACCAQIGQDGVVLVAVIHWPVLSSLCVKSVEAPRMVSTLGLVAAGLGVSLVPASMRRLQAEGVAYRPLAADAGLTAPLNLAYRRDDAAAALRRFVALVRGLAAAGEPVYRQGR